MSPHQAGQIARELRQALAIGRIDAAAYAVASVLLFSFRRPGHLTAIAAIATICRHTRLGRTKVKEALARLRALGVFARIKRRRRWAWGDSVASRQDSNGYAFTLPRTEVAGRPVDQAKKILKELEATKPSRQAGTDLLQRARTGWFERYQRGRQPRPG